ncbi:putative hydrolase [Escherichia coli]|uniref:Putative hydrolase n=1 Tax=Escherichia coli TaxID=562 RepID=A0A376L0U4_ECOLX|nr:hypothetical protein ECC1470_25151 [Escherichia coli ECC-1470]STE87900.1 putative hydrolase [Escherichia coli]
MARLAAFDMDGTLLMPDHHLGEKTLSTLARLRERDITLTFATGRHALEMQHILGALSLDAYLITGNGTRVHSLEGELLHRDDLPADVAELVLYQQWDTRASMHIFNDDGWFTGKEIPALLQAFVYSGFSLSDNRCQKNATRQRHQDLLLWRSRRSYTLADPAIRSIRRACTFVFFRHGLPRSAAGGLQ